MSKQWYEKHPLRWAIFNQHNTEYSHDRWFATMFWLMALAWPAIVFAVLVINPIADITVALGTLLFCFAAPVLGKLHPLGQVPSYVERECSYIEGIYRDPNPLWKLLERYWDLPAEDRRQFPSNLMQMVKDPDITAAQRDQIIASMNKTFEAIAARNAARNNAVNRNVDISSVLQYMSDQRRGLKIEQETYQELK